MKKFTRKIPKLIFGPIHVEKAYADASKQYQWFRRDENRFKANGIHGHSGSLLFEAFDEGLKDLPKDRFKIAFMKDAAQHTKARFKKIAQGRVIMRGRK